VPERPLPKALAGPGLLAHVLISTYADHIPLHRQESIFKREGVPIARSTLCGWVQGSVELLRHIVEAMWNDAKGAPIAIADATGVLVMAQEVSGSALQQKLSIVFNLDGVCRQGVVDDHEAAVAIIRRPDTTKCGARWQSGH
jgi:hypothetical protein